MLGPQLFSLYIADIESIVLRNDLQIHLFADDIVIYGFTNPNSEDMRILSSRLSLCLDEVKKWLDSNRLSLNPLKTQAMWCHSPRRRINTSIPVRVDNVSIIPEKSVKYLGVILDSTISFVTNVSKTASVCFAMLRRIRSLRRSLTRPLLVNMVTALVINRLEYCISVHAGLPASTTWRLQRVLHASARLIYGIRRNEHISFFLKELSWLSIKERIDMRLGTFAYKCKAACAPEYLSDLLVEVASLSGRQRLRSSTSRRLSAPRTFRPTLGGRNFQSAASRVWNGIPNSVSSAQSVTVFKRNFKKFLLACKEA